MKVVYINHKIEDICPYLNRDNDVIIILSTYCPHSWLDTKYYAHNNGYSVRCEHNYERVLELCKFVSNTQFNEWFVFTRR